MIVIDGSEGEGGGQVLRAALACSLATGRPFRIERIRGGRPKPGLMRQHLTAVEAACAIGAASCTGARVGSTAVEFAPRGRPRGGDWRFAIGTAGSTALVLQAVLPALLLADAPSRLTIEGGTHAPDAPPFEFVAQVFLPALARMGMHARAKLVRPGFYPVGGGCIEVEVEPARTLRPLDMTGRGALLGLEARAIVAGLDDEIAERELQFAARGLPLAPEAMRRERWDDRHGPGNVLLIEARFEGAVEIVAGFGRPGLPAHAVGEAAATRMAGFIASGAAVGPQLADQLLLPMALAGGGCFTTVRPTRHARTAAAVIARFFDVDLDVAPGAGLHRAALRVAAAAEGA